MIELYTLLLLACPVVMGAMMWMIMRGSGTRADSSAQEEIAQLRNQVEQLRVEQPRDSEAPARQSPGKARLSRIGRDLCLPGLRHGKSYEPLY